jgi:hypothetical protein
MRWHLPASLLLHAAVLIALIFLQPVTPPTPRRDDSLNVQLVQLPQPRRPVTVETRPLPDIAQDNKPSPLTADKIIQSARKKPVEKIEPRPKIQPKPAPDALITATELYSASLLADRHNRSAREAMKTLALDERIIQLCNIEAMEQVRRTQARLKPDYIIAYAMADLKLSQHAVDAEGGAFFSHSNWYGLKFRCDVSPDDARVISFAFLVGQPIPKSEWASHNLTADASSAD